MWPYNKSSDAVRVAIESRIILFDDRSQTAAIYYLGASCKSEDTYGTQKDYSPNGFQPGANTLFHDPNYDFSWIVGNNSALIFRRLLNGKRYREVLEDTSVEWGEMRLQLSPAIGAYWIPVDKFEPAARATDAGHALVAQTEISNRTTGLRAVIEYPVKTMNVSRDGYPQLDGNGVWQIDTGPIGVPDLSKRHDPPVSSFSLGFIATISRNPQAADFVLEQPTPLKPPNEGISILHYSKPYSHRATNRLIGIPHPER
tara:strand:+ start:45 stop:815 length:771 start_codon:yes stop_codon:yes gene_type:complete